MRLAPRDPAWPPPRLLDHWQVWALLMAVLVIPFFVPIPVDARRSVLISALGDRLHIVLPAGIMLMLYWRGPLRGRLLAVAAATALIGGAIEFIQKFFGRTPLLHDWMLDLVGIGMVLGWVGWRGHKRPAGLALVAALLALTAYELRELPGRMIAAGDARARFPMIEDFEDDRAMELWADNYDAVLDRSLDAAHGGAHGLRLAGGPPARWPGATMRRFPHDWTGYTVLEMTVRNPAPDSGEVRFHVRVDDFQGVRDHDRITSSFTAGAGWTTIAMPVVGRTTDNLKRPFDPTDVDAITIFLSRPAGPAAIEIDDIRLR